jgi:uncharacterized protein
LRVVNTNITGTIYLIQKAGRDMRARKAGRILITGSIAGFIPGTYQAVYNATKAFLDSFSFALRAEVKDRYYREMPDARCDRDRVLCPCRHARYRGRPGEEGRRSRRREDRFQGDDEGQRRCREWLAEQAAIPIANMTPASLLAERHRKKAAPGSAKAG